MTFYNQFEGIRYLNGDHVKTDYRNVIPLGTTAKSYNGTVENADAKFPSCDFESLRVNAATWSTDRFVCYSPVAAGYGRPISINNGFESVEKLELAAIKLITAGTNPFVVRCYRFEGAVFSTLTSTLIADGWVIEKCYEQSLNTLYRNTGIILIENTDDTRKNVTKRQVNFSIDTLSASPGFVVVSACGMAAVTIGLEPKVPAKDFYPVPMPFSTFPRVPAPTTEDMADLLDRDGETLSLFGCAVLGSLYTRFGDDNDDPSVVHRIGNVCCYDGRLMFTDTISGTLYATGRDPYKYLRTKESRYVDDEDFLWTAWYECDDTLSSPVVYAYPAHGNLYVFGTRNVAVYKRTNVSEAPLAATGSEVLQFTVIDVNTIGNDLIAVGLNESNKLSLLRFASDGVKELMNDAVGDVFFQYVDDLYARTNNWIYSTSYTPIYLNTALVNGALYPAIETRGKLDALGGDSYTEDGDMWQCTLVQSDCEYVCVNGMWMRCDDDGGNTNRFAIGTKCYNSAGQEFVELKTVDFDWQKHDFIPLKRRDHRVTEYFQLYPSRKMFSLVRVHLDSGCVPDPRLDSVITDEVRRSTPYDGTGLMTLSISKDKGTVYSPLLPKAMPTILEGGKNICWRNCGSGNNQSLRLDWTSYRPLILYGLELETR